jgi:hypothetical protein
MPLRATLTSLDGIDPSLVEHYRQDGDKFVLDVEPSEGFALENITGLKSALQSERGRVRELEQSVKKFDGIDPQAALDALGKLDQIDNWSPDEKMSERMKSREAEISKKFTAEVDAAKAQADKMRSELEKQLIHNATVDALRNHGGNVDLLLPHVKGQARLEESENGYRVVVVGDNGEARVSMKSGSVDNMTIDELVETMRVNDSFAPAFSGSGASGGGSTGSAVGNRGGGAPFRLSYEDAKNPAKYQRAKAAAEKAGVPLEIEQYQSRS